jgi:hypothetical protein
MVLGIHCPRIREDDPQRNGQPGRDRPRQGPRRAGTPVRRSTTSSRAEVICIPARR